MKTIRTLIVLVALVAVSSCASSTLTAYTDPEYKGASFDRVAVFALGMTFEASAKLETEVCKKLAPTPCFAGKSVLAPTRNYSEGEVQHTLGTLGIDSVLIVSLSSDDLSTRYLGSISNANGTATTNAYTSGYATNYGYGTTNYSANTTANTQYSSTTTTTPIYETSRSAFGQVTLYEVSTDKVAWHGQISTAGSGALSVTDSAFIGSASSEIASELKATGLYGAVTN